MVRALHLFIFLALLNFIQTSGAYSQETTVTTYIIKRQQERENTRFTLTEWLRIKERMKLMDLWLAMFSNPQKKFTPELGIYGGKEQGNISWQASGLHPNLPRSISQQKITAKSAKAQIWLTNLISGTFGVKTLNVDFGGEYALIHSQATLADYIEQDEQIIGSHLLSLVDRYKSVNLRIFGLNLQDSSLLLKMGEYQSQWPFLRLLSQDGKDTIRTPFYGAELQLYLFRWLGLEGQYLQYEKRKPTLTLSGTKMEYGAYIEISLLRLMFGISTETTHIKEPNVFIFKQQRDTFYSGLKINL